MSMLQNGVCTDPNQQWNHWTKALVITDIRGEDDKIRVVNVKTATGIIRRPLVNNYRIENGRKNK